MGRMPEAESYFAALLDEPEEQYGDLYLEAADALMAIGQYGRAVGFLEKLEVEHGRAMGIYGRGT